MGEVLRLLTYNIQVSIPMSASHHYVTRSWRHFLPHRGRLANLNDIADVVGQYDVVGLQEVDAGSMRSNFVNQVRYLAHRADFEHHEVQINRDLKVMAQYGNGVLSRYPMQRFASHKLPGAIPGRGALSFVLEGNHEPITFIIAHLALTPKTQQKQLSFIAELIKDASHAVVMGDFNVEPSKITPFLEHAGLCLHDHGKKTHPSWKPSRTLDYILTSPSLDVVSYDVLDVPFSDHLPVGVGIILP